nr:saccharopine dehydrogenase [Sphingomonadales bacterium]
MAERTVLVLGAGRSSGYLIEYLAQQAVALKIKIVVADQNLDWALAKVQSLPSCFAIMVQPGKDIEGLEKLVANATLVISLLPVHLHMTVAKACLKYHKPMFTASYQTAEMESLQEEIKSKGLL